MTGRFVRARAGEGPAPVRASRLAVLAALLSFAMTAWLPIAPLAPGVRAEEPPSALPGSEPSPTPTPTPVPNPAPPPLLPAHCTGWSNGPARAKLALAGQYQLGPHPVVSLGLDPTWVEDPLHDRNWQFLHHGLRLVLSLLETFATTRDPAYRDRAEFLLRDWIQDNPRLGSQSEWAWNDHSVALRAIVLACATPYLPGATWLLSALELHGTTLADETFYVRYGNHALDQSLGLLEVAQALGRSDWKQLAASRIATLVETSVDSQGVTNEQAVGYQYYNLTRYRVAESRLRALGLTVPPAFGRLNLMPNLLAHATRPDGMYETIGDTDLGPAVPFPGTWAEYAATKGARGPKPATLAVYRAGYLFARTGWGEKRPFADETFLSLRFGPAPYIHGHADGMALTLYGYGSALLLDPGKYSYNLDPYRTFFRGRTAHNVVTVDGVTWSQFAPTTLVTHRSSTTMAQAVTKTGGYAGVSQRRTVTFSRRLGYVLVEDRATSAVRRTFRQLWHLSDTANPVIGRSSFTTQRNGGNVQVRQLIGTQTMRVVTGRTGPIQGWVSYRHGERLAAPVVEVVKIGTSVRYLTLIVPADGQPNATVRDLRTTSTGYSLVVTVNGKSERVTVTATGASIVPLN